MKSFAALLFGVLFLGQVAARDLFVLEASTDQDFARVSFNELSQIVDSFDQAFLERNLPNYTAGTAVDLVLDVRGLAALASFGGNSDSLTFRVPSLGIDKTFQGGSRDENQQEFARFLRRNGDGILSDMLKQMVATTPIDPIAGNPNSLMNSMGNADFAASVNAVSSVVEPAGPRNRRGKAGSGQAATANLLTIGITNGQYTAEDYDQDVTNLPIGYTIRFDSDPRKQLILDLPVSIVDTQGATTYTVMFGLGYRFPVATGWSLTPGLRVGTAGSIELGSAAFLMSASLTSRYEWAIDDLTFALGNMVSHFKSQPVESDDFEVDYDLSNTMFKNGVGVEYRTRTQLFSAPTSWQLDVAHTNFTGDELYVDRYNEISLSFGSAATRSLIKHIRVGITYTQGSNDFSGGRFNLGYTF